MAIKFETFDMPKSESTLDEEQEKIEEGKIKKRLKKIDKSWNRNTQKIAVKEVEAWNNSHIRRA